MLKRFSSALTAILVTGCLALAANVPLVPQNSQYSEASQIIGTLNYVIGTINANGPGVPPGGLVSGLPAATTGTSIQTLGSTTLPAGTLAQVGQAVRVTCGGHGTAAGNNTLTISFGAAPVTYAAANTATTAGVTKAEMVIFKTGASTQNVLGSAVFNATPIAATQQSGTETDTNALSILCRGTSTGAAGDFTLDSMTVEQIK